MKGKFLEQCEECPELEELRHVCQAQKLEIARLKEFEEKYHIARTQFLDH